MSVALFKRLTAGGWIPRGPDSEWPILPVTLFDGTKLFTTNDDLTGLPESIAYEIRNAQASGQTSTETGNNTKLVAIAIVSVQVTDFYVSHLEIEFKRDADSVLRYLTTPVEATTDPTDPLSGASPTVRTFDPLIIKRLQSGATYDFRVRVIDIFGNQSDWSASVGKDAGNIVGPTAPLGEGIHNYTAWEADNIP